VSDQYPSRGNPEARYDYTRHSIRSDYARDSTGSEASGDGHGIQDR
jgi:hypothetical protein